MASARFMNDAQLGLKRSDAGANAYGEGLARA